MIYLLSILDNISSATTIFSVLSMCAWVIMFVLVLLYTDDLGDNYKKATAEEVLRIAKPWRDRMLIIGCITTFIAVATPNTDSLMKAFVMAEGRKVMTADNAEAATKALLDRADRLIEAIGKR